MTKKMIATNNLFLINILILFCILVPLIAGISSAVVVVILVLVGVCAYRRHQDAQAWARTGNRRPPKFGPSVDYCEGYYGDDRPGRIQLNNIEGDYYDYIEDDEDGKDEEGNRDYVYDQNGYIIPA